MPFQEKVFTTLLAILEDVSLPTRLHCHALQILSKLCGHCVICVEGLLLKYFMIYMKRLWQIVAKGHELMGLDFV